MGQRERERESQVEWDAEANVGLDPRPEPKLRVGCLTDIAAQVPHESAVLKPSQVIPVCSQH